MKRLCLCALLCAASLYAQTAGSSCGAGQISVTLPGAPNISFCGTPVATPSTLTAGAGTIIGMSANTSALTVNAATPAKTRPDANYLVQQTDWGTKQVMTTAGFTMQLPAASPNGSCSPICNFGNGWWMDIEPIAAGSIISNAGSTLNGGTAAISLAVGNVYRVWSDGTNYRLYIVMTLAH